MAHSIKSVRHLLKDKPTLNHLEHEISAQQALLASVRQLLPGELATHCIAARLDGTRLVMHCDSPVWASRLRFMATELRSLLQNDLAALREIKVRVLPQRRAVARRRRPARRTRVGATVVGDSALCLPASPLRNALLRLSETLAAERPNPSTSPSRRDRDARNGPPSA